jgi:peptide subunit release factor 1 (eRF1)
MWRYKNRNGLEDLKKAKWYLDYIKTDYIPCGDQFEAMSELLDQLMEKEENDNRKCDA